MTLKVGEIMLRRSLLLLVIVLGIGLVFFAMTPPATATPPIQFEDPLVQGEYLANILLCITCHTPPQAAYNPETNPDFGDDQIRDIALFGGTVLDKDRLMSGGTAFNLGPQGIIIAANLTPDETGLGEWTDEEIETALRTGVNRDGRRLHPIMDPVTGMADSDMAALILYLRSLDPVENVVTNALELPVPPAVAPEDEIIAPDPSDQAARGQYLVSMMHCSSCHTPIDPATGAPLLDRYLGGGEPFNEVFGTVYAGNITAHDATGLGEWSEDELKRAITQGIRVDNRRLGLMPWQGFANLTAADLDAIVFYLQNVVAPVDNTIPATALADPYIVFVDSEASDNTAAEEDDNATLFVGIIGAILVVLVGGAVIYQRSKSTSQQS
jgi:mono/diheme cytochrome c family protein